MKPEDEFQQCPSCSRKFGPKAYDRHVKWCMEKARRISNSPKKDLEALAKLQTRISYRYVNDVDEKKIQLVDAHLMSEWNFFLFNMLFVLYLTSEGTFFGMEG